MEHDPQNVSPQAEASLAVPPRPILFVHHANDMYGADISLLHSVQVLDRSQYEPIVLLPSDMPEGMLSAKLSQLGIEYHFAPLGILRRKYLAWSSLLLLGFDILRGILYVRRLSRQRKVAAVYVNTIVVPAGAIGGRLARVPVLWHVHEILSFSGPLRRMLSGTLKLCADCIVCVSAAVRDSLVQERSSLASKCVVLYNAVEVSSEQVANSAIPLRHELGIDAATPLVGMVGRITHWKGQEVLADAAALVLQSHPEAHFVAVGSYFADQAHYLEKLQQQIQSLGLRERFHLLDYRPGVASVYRALDIFVLPSVKPEPFGRVTVEAMLQGCAVIATNHGGSPELVQDGVTGLLVTPGDPAALADAIEKLLKDDTLRERLGEAAATHAKVTFGMQEYQSRIAAILDRLTTRG